MLLISQQTYAQTEVNSYQPLQQDFDQLENLLTVQEDRYKLEVRNIEGKKTHTSSTKHRFKVEDKYKDGMKAFFEGRYDRFTQSVENQEYYQNELVNTYFQQILNEILENNPDEIPENSITLLVSKYLYPNAYATGNHVLTFNLDLLKYLDNESQVAFIIAHEIAHQIKNHVNNDIIEKMTFVTSKAYEQKLENISNAEGNIYDKINKLLELKKDIVYDNSKHSRIHELEADSIALYLLKNTQYDATEAVACIENLDKIDELSKQLRETDIDLKGTFDTPNYPFKNQWIEEEASIFSKVKEADAIFDRDSIRTHPDCEKRAKALQQQLTNYQNENKQVNLQDVQVFEQLRIHSIFERIQNSLFFEDYTFALLVCLQTMQKYPNNAWVHAKVGDCFNLIYDAQKNHTLSKNMSLKRPDYSENYKQILRLFETTRLKDIAFIGYEFMEKHKHKFESNEEYMYVYSRARQNMLYYK